MINEFYYEYSRERIFNLRRQMNSIMNLLDRRYLIKKNSNNI